MRKKHGVESVRIIVATDAVLYSRSPVRLTFVRDCLHRCGRNNSMLSGLPLPVVSPICFTRYPTHPKGWSHATLHFLMGPSEERLRREFQFRLDVLSVLRPNVLKEGIVEINCRSYVVSEVVDSCLSIVSKHNHALPVRIYDRRTYSTTADFQTVFDSQAGAQSYGCLWFDTRTPLQRFDGVHHMNICLVDRTVKEYSSTWNQYCEILLARKKVPRVAARMVVDFICGKFSHQYSLKRWLSLTSRFFSFFRHSMAVREQIDYLEYRDRDSFFHLLAVHNQRANDVFSDVLTREDPSMPCLFCLPEWYGWRCSACTR